MEPNITDKINVVVKWSGKEYEIQELSTNDTVIKLKELIEVQTGVRCARQKLLNLKFKGKYTLF